MKKNKIFRAIPDLCTGCLECQMVCSLVKAGTVNPSLARIRVLRSHVDGSSDPIIRRHCKMPLCQKACPVPEAMRVDGNTGAVPINDDKCIGCLACMEACPFNAIWVGPNREVLKCDLCAGEPTCVKYCPTRPDHQFPLLPYPRASALEYVEPHRITRKDTAAAAKK